MHRLKLVHHAEVSQERLGGGAEVLGAGLVAWEGCAIRQRDSPSSARQQNR
jgi:hypothetical protein